MIIESKSQLMELVKYQNVPLIGAEIGVCGGGTGIQFLRDGLEKLYSIDSWRHLEQTGDGHQPDIWHLINMLTAASNLTEYGDKSVMIRGRSAAVSHLIPDESLGILYIDGDHSHNGVSRDLFNYVPKVVRGGIVAMHDYLNSGYGVTEAVEEFCFRIYEIHQIDNDGAYFIKS